CSLQTKDLHPWVTQNHSQLQSRESDSLSWPLQTPGIHMSGNFVILPDVGVSMLRDSMIGKKSVQPYTCIPMSLHYPENALGLLQKSNPVKQIFLLDCISAVYDGSPKGFGSGP
ncbi:hypothetical protein STEG23_005750, partial [Scotinomys teguina]